MTATALKTLRCATIGVGRMGRHHARLYAQTDGCDLVGVVDGNVERASKITEEWGGRAFARVQELIDHGVDAVTIATPTITHRAIVEPLLEAGIACLVEKPLAPDVAEARASLRELLRVLLPVLEPRMSSCTEAFTKLTSNAEEAVALASAGGAGEGAGEGNADGAVLGKGVGAGEGEALGGTHAALGPGDTTRSRPYRPSAMKRRPSGATVSAGGRASSAAEAAPPSPLLPG
jgi:hypothetical protein